MAVISRGTGGQKIPYFYIYLAHVLSVELQQLGGAQLLSMVFGPRMYETLTTGACYDRGLNPGCYSGALLHYHHHGPYSQNSQK